MATELNLMAFLEFLITPRNEAEQERFEQQGLVDDYIRLKNRIPTMTHDELVVEIDKQLAPYELSINENG